MENKSITITPPEGYEVDNQKSNSREIVFRPINERKLPKTWAELRSVAGFYIANASEIMSCASSSEAVNRNVWPTEDEARAALALSQLCQLRDRYNGQVGTHNCDQLIYCRNASGTGDEYATYILAFKTIELLNEFKHNFRDLIEEARPLL